MGVYRCRPLEDGWKDREKRQGSRRSNRREEERKKEKVTWHRTIVMLERIKSVPEELLKPKVGERVEYSTDDIKVERDSEQNGGI